jgi:outer membrane protein OmpA-like peptidoglycan-associated protein
MIARGDFKFIVWGFVLSVLMFVPSTATCAGNPMLELRLGLSQAALSQQHQPWAIGLGSDISVTVPVAEKTRLRLGIGWRRLFDDTISQSRIKFQHPDDRAARAWTQILLKAQALHPLGGSHGLRMYGGGGLGLSLWRIENYPDYDIVTVADDDGDPADYSATELVASAVFGIAPRLGTHFSLLAEINVDYLVGVGTNFDKATSDERSRAQATLSFGLAYVFGGMPSSGQHTDPYEVDFTEPAFVPLTADDQFEEQPATESSDDQSESSMSAIPGDSDGDGVSDSRDQCDNTPSGAIVNRQGCPFDGDNDGIYDGIDRCPGTPDSLHALVDEFGCPVLEAEESQAEADDQSSAAISDTAMILDSASVPVIETPAQTKMVAEENAQEAGSPDSTETVAEENADTTADAVTEIDADTSASTDSPAADKPDTAATTQEPKPKTIQNKKEPDSDGDGVVDSKDWCPKTLRGLRVDRHGCLVMTELQRRLVLHVSYMPGTTAPDATSLAVLRDLVERLKRSPESLVRVEGFTDNIGRDDDNLLVSQKRADRVKAYLVKKGIAKKRITAIGRGEAKFISSNKTAKGRAKNRRIEISFHRE